jgi:hypothetical protein
MWNMIIGAVSQATDPAKKLADDYYNYILSQGAVGDYATLYNIYKDEYLTDPDKDKMLYWFDFRGGKIVDKSNTLHHIFSLLPPYDSNEAKSTPSPIVVDNERIENGWLGGMYVGSKLNSLTAIGFRIVSKVKTVNPTPSTTAYIYINYAVNSPSYTNTLRLHSINSRRRSYIGYDDGTTVEFNPVANYIDGIHITEQIINMVNKTHRVITPSIGLDAVVAIAADKIALNTMPTITGLGLRLFGFPYAQNYWLKFYSL